MQTGFGDDGDNMFEQYIQTMTNILLPGVEKGGTRAGDEAKAWGLETRRPEGGE